MIKPKAQSTLEYILVSIAILLAIIAATVPQDAPIRRGVVNYLNEAGEAIDRVIRQ